MTRERGFVMADAIMALLILTVVMSALLSLATTSADSGVRAQVRLNATMIARSISESSAKDAKGEVSIDGRLYAWERSETLEYGQATQKARLKRITVRVNWILRADQNQVIYRTAVWEVPDA